MTDEESYSLANHLYNCGLLQTIDGDCCCIPDLAEEIRSWRELNGPTDGPMTDHSSSWVAVEDAMPKYDCTVLAIRADTGEQKVVICVNPGFMDEEGYDFPATHWQPLSSPPPPKEPRP